MPEIPVIVLFGPTASGKTEILTRLFPGGTSTHPQKIPATELVSADSMQVYRGMDIGTAKPPPSIRSVLPHHLIDILDPREQFNAGEFVRLADESCAAIHGRGALPFVSGGAGFYLKNFIQGLPESPPSSAALREELSAELRIAGRAHLIAELCRADPESAARIHTNDDYRLLRALEVLRLTGRPLSSYAMNAGKRHEKYRFLLIGLEWEREALYRRVNRRCARMFAEGLPREVRALFDKGYTPRDPGLRAIGYKEFFIDDFAGGWRLSDDLAGVEALVARHSRQYAKRQITWFKKVSGVLWVKLDEDVNSIENAAADVRQKIDTFLEAGDGL
ncbi:MAG: tRNA (adenosine(37)-N6)-dimethylallyltransferase MiaA [Spirochaetaceae bacterium]|jgi:tRNA dimethylallyltransferase|nr:tRNA (adenosine(37)-N6)-dimethylallyltransferase MiaA [Spirochaetaceae bacterium]